MRKFTEGKYKMKQLYGNFKTNDKFNDKFNKKDIIYSLPGPAWKSAQRRICLNYLL